MLPGYRMYVQERERKGGEVRGWVSPRTMMCSRILPKQSSVRMELLLMRSSIAEHASSKPFFRAARASMMRLVGPSFIMTNVDGSMLSRWSAT